ncbi:hypothetical protein AB6D20_027575 (plasmid) [Vibrio splendidus]
MLSIAEQTEEQTEQQGFFGVNMAQQGFFGVNMASTGQGKTFANARSTGQGKTFANARIMYGIMYGLSNPTF